MSIQNYGLPWWLTGKKSALNAGDEGSIQRVQSRGQEDPPRNKQQPTIVFLREKFHGQRTLLSYTPWGHKRVGHNLAIKQPSNQPI